MKDSEFSRERNRARVIYGYMAAASCDCTILREQGSEKETAREYGDRMRRREGIYRKWKRIHDETEDPEIRKISCEVLSQVAMADRREGTGL